MNIFRVLVNKISRSLPDADELQCYRLDFQQIELARRIVDVEADDITLCVEIGDQAFDDLSLLSSI